MSALEKKLVQDIKARRDVPLERALLIISGLETDQELDEYTHKLGQIHNGFIEKLKANSSISLATLRNHMGGTRAKLLFEYLWNTKPKRCNSNFLLTDVIDAQLNPDINQKVGSCIGLTALYTVLGIRESLNLTLLVSDSHILNRLRVDDIIYDIDNTDPLGFDCDMNLMGFVEYPIITILANVLNSRGIENERLDNLNQAAEDYKAAIEINPNYANAYNNLGNTKLSYENYSDAIRNYGRAIRLNKEFVEAYCNRGIAKESIEDYTGAIDDFDKAIEINSKYTDAYCRRGLIKQILGDYIGAIARALYFQYPVLA